ncbi:MAG TPA: DUF882 domain-containing protein [Pseudolabrys sp.]|nr:DUF882 domain-containing protein [Pseudolabrys sp.]
MVLRAARRILLSSTIVRAGATAGLAVLLVAAASASLQSASAEGDTRTLTFHHLHTGEDITITFKRNGRYDDAALKKLDWFMRDWRKEQSTSMDPHLFDLLWEVYREVGATAPIDVVCGYRSPSTNALLRQRSSGVAELSEHTLGHAMDFYIPGVPLEKLREIGLRLQRGGVGFYPSSGSPFVHMDTGNIRHWPRMTYAQLSKVFPDGRTVHVAADGRPLPRFALALADAERRGQSPNRLSLEQALAHGAISEHQEQTAEAMAGRQKRMLVAKIYGGKDDEETADEAETLASVPVATQRIVPLPSARPQGAMTVAAAKTAPKPAGAPYAMVTLGPNMFDTRGLWQTAPDALAALAQAETKPVEVASADPAVTGSAGADALAYAPGTAAAPPPRAKAMGAGVSKAMAAVAEPRIAATPNTTVVAKAGAASGTFAHMTSGAQRLDSPWLRAAMLTPSISHAMTVTRFGAVDPRGFDELLHKPPQALAMAFSADPLAGMRADRFTGNAVTFLATATFVRARTASLD